MKSWKLYPLMLVVCLFPSVGSAEVTHSDLEANKKVVRQFTSFANATDWDALASVVADDFHRHSAATAGPPVTSRDGFVQLQKSFLATFPDQKVTIETLVAEGDYVAMLATYSATHAGPLGDIPATGKSVSAPFLALLRLEAGMIKELWVEWDNMAMLNQLGVAPPAPAE